MTTRRVLRLPRTRSQTRSTAGGTGRSPVLKRVFRMCATRTSSRGRGQLQGTEPSASQQGGRMGLFDKMKGVANQAVGEARKEIAKAKDDFAAASADDPVLAHDAAAAASAPTAAAPVPLMEIVSHIDGKNAKVRLWPDRLEWERPRGLSGGKLTAGVLTGGASLLVTGVKGGKDEHDMVFLRSVTNVNSRKDGIMY